MYVHPFIAGLALVVATLAGAAISFIWTSEKISRASKIEHTILAVAYAVSLLVFVHGMFAGEDSSWALPASVMLMVAGTAWANWRARVKFWLLFGLMTVLGGAALLVTELYIPKPTLGVFFALNAPWLALMVWVLAILIRRTTNRLSGQGKQ